MYNIIDKNNIFGIHEYVKMLFFLGGKKNYIVDVCNDGLLHCKLIYFHDYLHRMRF